MIIMLIPQNPEELLGSFKDAYVIVEGKKDKAALRRLGIVDILDISGKSLESFVEYLKNDKNYIVLTDFDKEGERKHKIICEMLEKNKLKTNPRLRYIIKKSFGVNKIEELIKFSKSKEDVYNGKISTIDYKVFNRSRFYRKWCSRKTRCNWSNIWSD